MGRFMSFFLPRIIDSNEELPALVCGYVSIKSQGGTSSFEITKIPRSTRPFHGKPKDRNTAERSMEKMGLQIIAASRLGMSLVGPPAAWEELTEGKLVTTERLV